MTRDDASAGCQDAGEGTRQLSQAGIQGALDGSAQWPREGKTAMMMKETPDTANVNPSGDSGAKAQSEHWAARQDAILRSLAEGVVVLKNRRYVWGNRAMMEISGYSENELLGQSTALLYANVDDNERVGKEAYPTLAGGGSYEGEFLMRRKDLETRWVRVKGRAVDAADPMQDSIWIIEDITERKQAEQALVDAQNIARIGSFEWHPVTGELRWSDEHFRLWGLQPQSVKPSYELFRNGVHPDDAARLEDVLQQALRGGRFYDCEHRVRLPDGSVCEIHGRGEVTFDSAGKAVRMVGTVQDVTERKQAQELLRERDRRYRDLFEGSRDAIAVADMAGLIADCNEAFLQITGYGELAEVKKLTFLDLTPPEYHAMETGLLETQLMARGYTDEYEKEYIRKNGARVAISLRTMLRRDPAGKPLEMWAWIRNIEDGKRLRRANANLQLILNYLPSGVSIIDSNLEMILCNDKFKELLDLPDELFADGLPSLSTLFRFNAQRGEYGPGDPDEIVDALVKRARLAEPHVFDRARPNGNILEVRGNPLPGGGFITVHSDNTERKQAEAELRIAAKAFDSSEGMMITDANSVVLRVNRAFTKITGYTPDEVVGQTPRLLHSGRYDEEFYRAMWATIRRTGSWQGEIWDRRKNGEEYQKWLSISTVFDDAGAVTHYIGMHLDITELKKAQERINELAFYDQLTGLPNRTLLMDRVKQTMAISARSGDYCALLFIDLDNFKTLNDTHGHDMGDALLTQVSSRLTQSVRDGDTVARLGGDEFVVVLTGLNADAVDAATAVETVARKILTSLKHTFQLKNVTHHSSASIGATMFAGDIATIDELMKQADLAMYQAKEAGRSSFRFFDSDMQSIVKRRAALEEDLHHALEHQQFLLHYQAQVVGDGRRVTGAEALVRWKHPQRGMVSPADFVPLAEETQVILPLGRWVLETACAQLARWATRPEMSHLTIAVNVSALEFSQSNFVDEVLGILKRTAANPNRLKLELTESLLVDNLQEVIGKMFALKAKGVGFSLDDFGTGYSSLAYLKRLPLDQLKIDQSFVCDVLTDPNDAAIARTVVALAESLGLDVIAEGVETEDQREFLAASGCHAYQGYLFSRPLPLEGFEQFVQAAWVA